MRILAVTLLTLFAASSLSGSPAHAQQDPAPAGFEKFCATWMSKLLERERSNLEKAPIRREGSHRAIEYIGYDRAPLRCEAKATGNPRTPYIGKLSYREKRVRRVAPQESTLGDLTKSPAQVIDTSEVLEIFRFDGTRWVY